MLIGIQQEIYLQLAAISDQIQVIKEKKGDAEDSKFDFFVRDDGGVDSRMSNVEVLKKFGPGGLTEKEGYELYLQTTIRVALRKIQQTDEEGSEKGTTLWPSGALLDAFRAFDPEFQPYLMTEEEIRLLAAEAATLPDGIARVSEFFDIKQAAEDASSAAYPQEGASADGHGDAYRHIYWNALMTQKYGEDWTAEFGAAHEGVGGNTPAREAMDLYNNELGRKIATENPDASPEELAEIVRQKVESGEAIVIDSGRQIEWSNKVDVGANDSPAAVDIPLPAGER